MICNDRVVWSEGMLLQQQHLQQHDRYLHWLIGARCAPRGAHGWGCSVLELDHAQLTLGKLALRACEGIMPDGTPFSLPDHGDLPLPIDVPESRRGAVVVLALALARPGVPEVEEDLGTAEAGVGGESYARYRRADYTVVDCHTRYGESALVQVARVRMRLAFADEIGDAFASIGVARIVERRADHRLVLDTAYIPSCLDYRVAPSLSAFVDELVGLLRQRAHMLSARLAQPGIGAVAELADFLLLQLIHRFEPLLAHWAQSAGVHPEALYCALLPLAGELSGLTRGGVRQAERGPYRHDALDATFAPLVETVREALSHAMNPQAVAIGLDARPFGLHVARVADSTLFGSSGFVLTARADMAADTLAAALPQHLKLGPLESIDDLVNLQLPGIGLRLLPAAPRQLPFHAQQCYFALDATDPLWPQLASSGALAMHVAGTLPGLELQLWAIRQ
ncbi:type VI secretion system baseplate subunit TssK [Trinickia dabaoshanensis]|uniref:Type VI secretion system baseplate subunit TssK n=1 Tax=Trinickia dabaoshanensis TaxID=564714 RepID=A0A2N7VTG4_9BURK|nr:type VI secretion system baseplate subunit TssK [Trinickia dabaoshanensis]PMS20432.1 type VI secretion system baseplate subunit TssK [Trinickia dabaoshanensis]